MCQSLDVLSKNQNGYCMYCKSCHRFHLGFGTTGLVMENAPLQHFFKELEFQIIHWNDKINPGEKTFYFATESPYVKIILCYREMLQLYDLLANGFLIHKAGNLIAE